MDIIASEDNIAFMVSMKYPIPLYNGIKRDYPNYYIPGVGSRELKRFLTGSFPYSIFFTCEFYVLIGFK